jgi:hypothetical protein
VNLESRRELRRLRQRLAAGFRPSLTEDPRLPDRLNKARRHQEAFETRLTSRALEDLIARISP